MTIDILRANQVDVINATFGEFLAALQECVTNPPIPLSKRPPIVIPVARTTIEIEADEYEKDKRHFEILGTYVEELRPPSVKDSLNGQETWASFLNGHLIDRYCKNEFRNILTISIQNSIRTKPEILFVGAPPGWGKTFLLRDLSIDLYRSRRPVFWLTPHSVLEIDGGREKPVTLGKWDSVRIDHIIGMIADVTLKQSLSMEETTPIVIADNCPDRTREVLSLYKDLAANNRTFVLIFAVRDTEFESLVDDYPLLKKARWFRPSLDDSKEEVRKLIDFCVQHRIATIEDITKREIVAQRIISEEADAALILALQVIFDKNHRPFSEIVREFWQGLNNETAQKLVLRVASIHRFGSAFSPRLYSLLKTFYAHEQAQALQLYRECIDKGILVERNDQDEPCVYTLHSLIAEHLVKVSAKTYAEIDDALITVIKSMTGNIRDLEQIRHMLKLITDYKINLSSDEKTAEFLFAAADSTNSDWVVCQQIAKYLVRRSNHEEALVWAERALENNPDHGPLHHTKGNILRRWGNQLLIEANATEASKKFDEARLCFSFSRIRREADEYGYVTHLDMLLHLLSTEKNSFQRDNLIAEGVQLYNDGIRAVPEDQFRFLLEERFQRTFDLRGEANDALCGRIKEALEVGKSSTYAATFLAHQLYKQNDFKQAIEVLHIQRRMNAKGVLSWVKEAELRAREGDFSEAAKCIDSARRRESFAENAEALWSLMYWDLLIATISENFQEAREANFRLTNSGFFSKLFARQQFPRGYIWKESAKSIDPDRRSFKDHAKIWSGRIERMRAGDRYGQIVLTNMAGETFNIDFNPRYFTRGDLRRGDHLEFVITILPNRLRADDINSKPFLNTSDDLFVL